MFTYSAISPKVVEARKRLIEEIVLFCLLLLVLIAFLPVLVLC